VTHGDTLELTVDGDKLLFFDPATGDRVGVKKLAAAAT
jgi:hypothetical protein